MNNVKLIRYTGQMDKDFISAMDGKDYLSVSDLKAFTKRFNEVYGQEKTITGIAAHFRVLKTKRKHPVKIAYRELYPQRYTNAPTAWSGHAKRGTPIASIQGDAMKEFAVMLDHLMAIYCKVCDDMKSLREENMILQNVKKAMEACTKVIAASK